MFGTLPADLQAAIHCPRVRRKKLPGDVDSGKPGASFQ
jgi:hypothetical protein